MSEPIIVVHAGAGTWKNVEDINQIVDILKESLEAGYNSYKNGNCLDMVTSAIEVMENSGILNAGLGSTLDYVGNVTMDAGIVNGNSLKAGAVAAVTYPKNPIKLARFVLEKTPHLLIAGQYADKLAKKINLEKHPGPSKNSIYLWNKLKNNPNVENFVLERINAAKQIGYDTVGSVAIDKDGCLSAGVSTGGVSLKLPGRVGDSPIFGAGYYANKKIAVAATGIGEVIMTTLLSYKVSEIYEINGNLMESMNNVIEYINKGFGKDVVGIIGIDYKKNVYGIYNTEAMPWGYITLDKKIVIKGLPNM
ncbi:asparaginase [Caldisphaera lagunensis DSM 15908]|uniref:Plant-type L-asparaginase n=1 Tax=Caldisphaera lagunensis (strain DSM 15908 / JCM 11604 / ANMR 0165 / IC-154) TaxID=1056495 RepID=L0A8H9_CALLD|nr:isoaspartyl peptidase/L-asparaginase [Caldisphaera lagunensis]AFZ70126.1 asparaginase [Caldisphaera lagunensis DSM 15908]